MLFSYVQFWKFQKYHFGISENDFKSYNMECVSTTSLYVEHYKKKKIPVTFINTSFQRGTPIFLIIGRRDRLNIHNMTKRQFDAVIRKEGMNVSDYYDSTKTYTVFFRRNNRSNSPQGKLRMYYAQDTDISVGTVFVLKGTTYLVISQDALESNIYFTSLAVKCDASLSVCISENNYMDIPCAVISDKFAISHGNVISVATGNVTVYTGINQYSLKLLETYAYYNFGGYYKLGTSFQNNGLLYVYMTKEAMPNVDKYSLTYNGVTSLSLSDGTYQLSYTAVKNGSVVDNPSLSYAVNDSNIATVSDTGLLTMIAAGNVTVTATWTDGNNTICVTAITIADSSDPDIPNPPVSTGTIVISGKTNLKNGYYRTYSAIFYDSSNSAVDGIAAVWSITDCTFINEIEQTVLEGNKFKVKVNNENLIGQSFSVNATDSNGNFTMTSITVTIVE